MSFPSTSGILKIIMVTCSAAKRVHMRVTQVPVSCQGNIVYKYSKLAKEEDPNIKRFYVNYKYVTLLCSVK